MAATNRLSVGDNAPQFTLPDAHETPVSLSDYAGRKVIVYFYPAAMTPGCTTQAVDFTAHLDDFTAAGYDVLGISPDPVDKLQKFLSDLAPSAPASAAPRRAAAARRRRGGSRRRDDGRARRLLRTLRPQGQLP